MLCEEYNPLGRKDSFWSFEHPFIFLLCHCDLEASHDSEKPVLDFPSMFLVLFNVKFGFRRTLNVGVRRFQQRFNRFIAGCVGRRRLQHDLVGGVGFRLGGLNVIDWQLARCRRFQWRRRLRLRVFGYFFSLIVFGEEVFVDLIAKLASSLPLMNRAVVLYYC